MHSSKATARAAEMTLRRAQPNDAAFMAWAANTAGDGLPLHLWTEIAEPGEDPWAVGRARALRTEGRYAYTNGWITEVAGRPAGCLIGYALAEQPLPIAADISAILRPLQELENQATGSWYINILAVDPASRRQGVGCRMLDHARVLARSGGQSALSLIVLDSNAAGRALYAACGFEEAGRQPVIKDGWTAEGESWLLMTRRSGRS